MEVTIQIPQFFIDVMKQSKVWKDNITGDEAMQEATMTRVFHLYLDLLMAIGTGWEEEGIFQFIENQEDYIQDTIYESSIEI